MNRLWLYTGSVAHKRLGEAAHAFCYPALFICFPLSERPRLANRLFGYNRFNLFSFHEQDHGDGIDSERWLRNILARQDLTGVTGGDIWLQTQPRILGFVFNPVSFWYCHDHTQQLRAVVCEVNNTFGERHCYLLTAADQAVINAASPLHCQKIFHVSPFFPVDGEYHFRFYQQDNKRTVAINYWQNQQLRLKTVITGSAMPLSPVNLIKAFARLGWNTALVVSRIHWQALKLWRKGAVFHRKPVPPHLEISS